MNSFQLLTVGATLISTSLVACSSVKKKSDDSFTRNGNPSRSVAATDQTTRQTLVKTFEYTEPMEESFDRRVVVLPEGNILTRIVSGRNSVMREFFSDGQLKSSFAVPRSFHDKDSFVVLSDGTIVVLTARDKSLSFYRPDRQLKKKLTLDTSSIDSLSEELIGLGNNVAVYTGRSRAKALDLYDSSGGVVSHIPLSGKAYAVRNTYLATANNEIAVPLVADPDGVKIYDSAGKLLKQVALANSRYIPAPIPLKSGNMLVQCDVDSICVYSPDGALRWRHDFPNRSFAGLPMAVLPDEGVVCQTQGDGVYIFNADGSVRTHLFAGEHVNAWGPAVVSPEGYIALFRWHENPSQPGRVSRSYLFLNSQGDAIGEFTDLRDSDAKPVAVDGKTFLLADGDHLVGLKIVTNP